jgi:hypothetical protein
MDRRVFLKVKLKNLAEEAKIIAKEEKRNNLLVNELYRHRKDVVGREARNTQLAYCVLRRVPLSRVERKAKTAPDWNRVEKMIFKYGLNSEPHQTVWGTNRELQQAILQKAYEAWRKGEE